MGATFWVFPRGAANLAFSTRGSPFQSPLHASLHVNCSVLSYFNNNWNMSIGDVGEV